MYRRLIAFGMAVCGVALVALLIPLTLSARDSVQTDVLAGAAGQARAVANTWEEFDEHSGSPGESPGGDGEHSEDGQRSDDGQLPSTDQLDGIGTVSLIQADGEVRGAAPPPNAEPAVKLASRGASASQVVEGWGYVTTPAYLASGNGVVLITLSPADLRTGLSARLAALGLVSAVLLAFAGLAAWLLARRTVAPLKALTGTANRVADGDLSARAPLSSVSEIEQVGVALNRLTGRVEELLAEERSVTAELAHQLRTPLTVLSLDVDGVADDAVRERLRDDVDSVQQMVDEIINAARRTSREGLQASCDAAAVVKARVRFWQVLADDQHRGLRAELPDDEMPVRLMADDLAAAVDILLQNVFLHTPEGTGFGVCVRRAGPWVEVEVADSGPGLTDNGGSRPPGTTGLGLSIAQRLAEASGGTTQIDSGPGRGTRVVLQLGPPRD